MTELFYKGCRSEGGQLQPMLPNREFDAEMDQVFQAATKTLDLSENLQRRLCAGLGAFSLTPPRTKLNDRML